MVGPCSSCGPYNQYCGHQATANYSSMFWQYDEDDNNYMSSSSSAYASSSSPSVDCTLSLGTPSTRLSTNNDSNNNDKPTPHRSSVSSFCWDLLSGGKQSSSTAKNHRTGGGAGGGNGGGNGGDSLLARRCANCDTTSTPLWRNGPRGPKSLCNACGIRFKKEERRAAAASTTASSTVHHNNNGSAGMMDPHSGYYNGASWAHQYAQAAPQKMQWAPSEFRFIEDDHHLSGSDTTTGIQFLSWLTHDRPSGLVHDFTR